MVFKFLAIDSAQFADIKPTPESAVPIFDSIYSNLSFRNVTGGSYTALHIYVPE